MGLGDGSDGWDAEEEPDEAEEGAQEPELDKGRVNVEEDAQEQENHSRFGWPAFMAWFYSREGTARLFFQERTTRSMRRARRSRSLANWWNRLRASSVSGAPFALPTALCSSSMPTASWETSGQ